MSHASNPFDRFELDPSSDLAEITEALRDRSETLAPEERPALRSAWEALTLHPRHRLELALTAVPESRAPLGAPPARAAPRASAREAEELTLTDLVGLSPLEPSLEARGPHERALFAPRRVLPPK